MYDDDSYLTSTSAGVQQNTSLEHDQRRVLKSVVAKTQAQRHPQQQLTCGLEVGRAATEVYGRGEGGRGGRRGVLPKRLKSGSGHHRLEICVPSNGRHKLA